MWVLKCSINTQTIWLVSQATGIVHYALNLAAIPMMTISCADNIGKRKCYEGR